MGYKSISARIFGRSYKSRLLSNSYYTQCLARQYRAFVHTNARILHMGSHDGALLAALEPAYGVGIEHDTLMREITQARFPKFTFIADIIELESEAFDFIIISHLDKNIDLHVLLTKLNNFCDAQTRVIFNLDSHINFSDFKELLDLENFEIITHGRSILSPVYMPGISWFCNTVLVHVPVLNRLSSHNWVVARKLVQKTNTHMPSVSIIIPCRNERGNVESAITRMPHFAANIEFIFVEGHSRDNTLEEIQRVARVHSNKNIKVLVQDGRGKNDAVRKGFAHASGDILMILDSDLTVTPEEFPKFYKALVENKAEFINGSRLVYKMETGAMPLLNFMVNHAFGFLVSWIIGQKVKDTLCGTKVIYKRDYEKLVADNILEGKDPFGDFDLIFGAAKRNLKIIDMPVYYKSRTYGTTQVKKFVNGLRLLKLCWLGFMKLKLRKKQD